MSVRVGMMMEHVLNARRVTRLTLMDARRAISYFQTARVVARCRANANNAIMITMSNTRTTGFIVFHVLGVIVYHVPMVFVQ